MVWLAGLVGIALCIALGKSDGVHPAPNVFVLLGQKDEEFGMYVQKMSAYSSFSQRYLFVVIFEEDMFSLDYLPSRYLDMNLINHFKLIYI